jgi:hypothetical protein
MTGRRRAALALLAVVAVTLLGPWHLAAGAGESIRATRSLAVDIGFGSRPGPETLRERLIDRTVARLAGSPCFTAVGPARADSAADLLLLVTLDDFEDKTYHDASISERVSPNSNPMDLASRAVATVSAQTRAELRLATATGAVVRQRRFLAAESYRPQHVEDPRQEAEERFVEALAADLRAFACKGDARKLARDIDKAAAER